MGFLRISSARIKIVVCWLWEGLEQVVMVCQAAGQTRFRALKHENGIAGSATIIVRVIACFQPLQDCQVSVRRFLDFNFIVLLYI